MADYLSTNTPRLKMTQSGPRGTHHMTFRVGSAIEPPAALTAVTPIIQLMLPFMMSGTAWSAAEWAAQGSDVFLPITFTPIIHPDNTEYVTNLHEYGAYINFVGRSTGGSRVAFYLFNITLGCKTANNRLTAAEHAGISPLLAAFAANAATLAGIDQNPFVLKAYANSGVNGKVAKKSRSLV